jgi:hypothetical protein
MRVKGNSPEPGPQPASRTRKLDTPSLRSASIALQIACHTMVSACTERTAVVAGSSASHAPSGGKLVYSALMQKASHPHGIHTPRVPMMRDVGA